MQPHGRILPIKTSKLQWIPIVLLTGCGPNMRMVRQYMGHSLHRQVVVLPFDLAPDQKDLTLHAADMIETRMRDYGFLITDRQLVRPLYFQSAFKDRAFDNAKGCADLGRSLGVQAVLVGRIDEAYERAGGKVQAGFAAQARLVDVMSGKVLWQQGGVDRTSERTVYGPANRVTKALVKSLVDAFLAQGL